jgi:methylmalonyl-CoA decarboxylase
MDDLQVEKPLVSPRIDGQIGTIVIDNPEKRNALSHGLIEALIATLEAFAAEDVRAAILRARPGVKVWSSSR